MNRNPAETAMPQTVPEALIRAADRFGDIEALVDHSGGREVRLTYRELFEHVRGIARHFLDAGIGPGDRIAVNSPNTQHWVVAALAALHLGATLVPINTRFTAIETLDILRRSDARMLLVAGPFLGADRLDELRSAADDGSTGGDHPVPGLPRLRSVVRIPVESSELTAVPGIPGWDELTRRSATTPLERVDEIADAVRPTGISDILYTSGTTGHSKGVLSAHHQALSVAQAWAGCGELCEDDRYLVVNPFFHSFGYKAGILTALLTGATLVPIPVFDVPNVMDLVHRERITVLPGPPTLYQSILDEPSRADHDLSSLRLAVTGAATVPVALIERMQTELSFSTVLTAYGLTEAVVATMCRPGDDPATVAGTCGRPAAGFDLRIGDSAGQPLPPGSIGEVLLRGPNTMLGYCDDPALTDSAIDAEGWLHTGDVGRVNHDGYLTITDRLKDMFISGGFNVYPAEVEQTLARLEGIADSAVVGVPDERLGEVGKAYVVLSPEHSLSEQDILRFCRERLANYKRPRSVEFRASLPRNPSGKVLKHTLRE